VILTIGHSDHRPEVFVALLEAHAVEALVDVRAWPRSRRHSQFESKTLAGTLAAAGIEYHWWGRALGGMRRAASHSVHDALGEPAFRAYAQHMASSEFGEHMSALRDLATRRVVTLMCAEGDHRACHRHLIADYLVIAGVAVEHIGRDGRRAAHIVSDTIGDLQLPPVYNRHAHADLFRP